MSKKKNYKAMYNKQADATIPEVTSIVMAEDTTDEEATVIGPIEIVDTVEPVEEPKCEFVTGVVTGCSRLNVRVAPDLEAEAICVIPVWSEVQICTTHNIYLWYHVLTAAGQEGYCMKQFIEIK